MRNKQNIFWPPERTAIHRRCKRRLQEYGNVEIEAATSYRVRPEKDKTMEEPVI